MYDEVIVALRDAYNRSAGEREKATIASWKQEERQQFLALLQSESKQFLLEVGAGTGSDSLFFQQQGLDVACTDLSPEMVELSRRKGLRAYVQDFLHLDFPPATFDAVYALNCLLHVPKRDLPAVLQVIQHFLRPSGLFYLGLYGGTDTEGVWADDWHEPKRFFSLHTDEGIQQAVAPFFQVLSFRCILVDQASRPQFQSLVLRR